RAAAIFDVRVASAGFLTAIGQTGTARIDFLRRDGNNEVQFDARYSLFGRLHTGGSYTHSDALFGDYGSAWLGAQFPLGEHEAGATVVERYELEAWATDLAMRYAIPFPRFRLTLAADVTNVFASEEVDRRAVRLWVRARL
ncbi:MAG TPA: hypothetical protein VE010_17615, partial [Thermoanaerobaculia bacterium]|nr:hypothetical protein [Thermoanaerobaculia bacterium]